MPTAKVARVACRDVAEAAYGLAVALVTEPRVAFFSLLFFGGGLLLLPWWAVKQGYLKARGAR